MLDSLKRNRYFQLIIVAIKYLLGFGFVFPSIVKIKGERFAVYTAQSEEFGTAFHLFETLYHTGLFWQLIGFGQFVAGALLITHKYSKLGSIIYFPIISGIVCIVWSLDFGLGTPVITTLMLMANLILILWEYNSLKILINLPPDLKVYPSIEDDPKWTFLGIFFLIPTVFVSYFNRHLIVYILIPFSLIFLGFAVRELMTNRAA